MQITFTGDINDPLVQSFLALVSGKPGASIITNPATDLSKAAEKIVKEVKKESKKEPEQVKQADIPAVMTAVKNDAIISDISHESLRALVTKLIQADKTNTAKVQAVFSKFNTKNVATLDPTHFEAFEAELKAI